MRNYIVTRVAARNPKIKGRTLYLTNIGLWSLKREHAHKFTRADAEAYCKKDSECSMEEV